MKKINIIFLMSLSLLFTAAFVACSNDDDNNTTPPATFELVSMEECNLAELDEKDFVVGAIEFSTNSNWRVSSDKMWVLFSDSEEGEFFNDIRGTKGSHRVYMKITNEARTFEPSVAKAVIDYANEQYELGTFNRQAKKPSLQITDENGGVAEEIYMESASNVISFAGNSDIKIKSYPEWIADIEMENGLYTITIANEYVPYTLSGDLTVELSDGTEQVLPLKYAGISPTYMLIESDYPAKGWNISLDGKVFKNKSTSTDEEATDILVENYMPCTIKCLNYDCEFVFLAEDSEGLVSVPTTQWLVAEQDKTNPASVLVYASPFEAVSSNARKGMLFAVPAGVKADFMAAAESGAQMADFENEYSEYLLIEATQKDIYSYNGFLVTDSNGNTFECGDETDEDLYLWVSSDLFTNANPVVCSMTGENGVTYTINTLIAKVEGKRAFAIHDSEGNVSTRVWGSPVMTTNADGYYVLTLKVPADSSKFVRPLILRIHDENNVNVKALIIKPVNYGLKENENE